MVTLADSDLKIWPAYYDAVLAGTKRFEVRRDDRDYQVGRVFRLREWDPGPRCAQGILGQDMGRYTGRRIAVIITYVLRDVPGLEPGYCVWGFRALGMEADSGG